MNLWMNKIYENSIARILGRHEVDAELQELMSRYSQSVYELSNTARADYQVLQAAIKSGNVPDAQAALARLQSDNGTPMLPLPRQAQVPRRNLKRAIRPRTA